MRVKRMVLPFITLVFLASQLAGCAALNSQEFLAEAGKVDEVVIEYNELEASESPEQSGGIEGYITQSPQSEGEDDSIGVIGGSEVTEVRELTEDELVKEFEATYAAGEEFSALLVEDESNEWVVLDFELEDINLRFDNRSDIKKPANLDEQYMNWRAEAHPGTTTQASGREKIQLFVECNEVVYAVDQVNIRASYTVNSNKLGSLTRGQSITRIGNGIQGTEAEGWSKVQLSDGTIAYMVSSYLSTTKPTTQTKPGGTTHKPPNTGTQTPGTPDNTIPQLPSSRPAGYDPNFDPGQWEGSGFEKIDDPWEGQAEIDFGD